MKLYKAKTISGAQARVRELTRQLNTINSIALRISTENLLLAKLAAEGPCFFNPMDVMAAKEVRDRILGVNGIDPDGTFKVRA